MLITGPCCCPVKIDLMLGGNQEDSCTRVIVNLIVPEIGKKIIEIIFHKKLRCIYFIIVNDSTIFCSIGM
jgi:hypothetical protein